MALVDDPVALVDDGTEYVGSQVTIFPGIRINIKIPKIITNLRKRR